MIDANLIEDLVRAGVAPDLVGRVAHMMVEAEALATSRDRLEKRRTADRERKQRERGKTKQTGTKAQQNGHSMSRDVTGRHVTDDDFEQFWKAYPKRGSASNPKKPARDKFDRAVAAGADPKVIVAAARRFCEVERQNGNEGTKFIPQATRWLNEQRWNDYPAPAAELVPGVHVKADTPEWNAWCGWLRRQGKPTPPTDKAGGWRFETQWPPVVAQQGAH